MSTPTTDKHAFKAEVKQLLDIVIHSLYTDKEIFIRELISNASDALEKLRHTQLTEKEIYDDTLSLEINVNTDDKAKTITFQDFGIGMTREELVQNLGTIAHSGTKAFLQAIESGQKPEGLIGQFGVGFYSAFMVAKSVKVFTHSWRNDAEHLIWTSDGSGNYEVETTDGQRRGCKIVIELKDDATEFCIESKVKNIIQRYSSFVNFPVNLNGEKLNTVQAIWTKNKSEITEEQYTEFYKYQASAYDEPMFRLHFNADAPIAINALVFVPGQNTERFGFGRIDPGVSLYCKQVLIDDKPEKLLPDWLRFLRGVIDSADLPLNISRETMQDSALVNKLGHVITKRVLKMLHDESGKNPELYEKFYKQFSAFIKEGVATDHTHREGLAKLLRYESSLTEAGKTTSLEDYVTRMKESQKDIYYLHALSRSAIETGPYLEAFKARGIEVLFVYEAIDEFVMSYLVNFKEKKIVAADQADLDLGETDKAPEGQSLSESEASDFTAWLRQSLGERVGKVETGKRLVESPVIALNNDKMATPAMRRMMKAMHQEQGHEPLVKMDLEINPRHKLIQKLNALRTANPEKAKVLAEQLADNAMLAAGLVEDPRVLVNRLHQILEFAAE